MFRKHKPSKPPKPGTCEFQCLREWCDKIKFIVLVVNQNEYQAAVTLMRPPKSFSSEVAKSFSSAVVFPTPDKVVGLFGDKEAALIFTDSGFDCHDYVQDAIDSFPNVQFVISIGSGFAFDCTKFKLGDVLVSKQICDLKKLEFDNSNELLTGDAPRVYITNTLSSIFCLNLTHEEDFKVSSNTERCSKVSAGQLVTLTGTVENKEMRNKISRSLPRAIGGETEGGRLVDFWLKRKIEGVAVIKGVSEYADGSIGDEWEFTASLAALYYANSKLYYYNPEGIAHYSELF